MGRGALPAGRMDSVSYPGLQGKANVGMSNDNYAEKA